MQKFNFYKFNSINILSYLLILLPFFLISGSFLSDLSITILAISIIFYSKDYKFFKNYFFIFFLIFWILMIVSSSFSNDKIVSYKSSIFYFRFCLFSLFVWWIIEKNKNILRNILFALIISFMIIIFDSMFQYLNGHNIFGMKIIQESRVSSFFGDELIMGGFLMRLTPLLIALILFHYKGNLNIKYFFLIIISVFLIKFTIFLSGERTSFFLFLFMSLLFIVFLHDFLKIKILFCIIYLLFGSHLLLSDSPFKDRLIDNTIKELKKDSYSEEIYFFTKHHHQIYLTAWNIYKDNKLIGIGPKSFRNVCSEQKYSSFQGCSTHPHNFPLQILVETGLLGFTIYLILNLFIWYQLLKSFFLKIFYDSKYLNNFQISLLIAILILIWPLSPNGSFFNNWMSIMIYYPVGFLLWSIRNNKKMYINLHKIQKFFK